MHSTSSKVRPHCVAAVKGGQRACQLHAVHSLLNVPHPGVALGVLGFGVQEHLPEPLKRMTVNAAEYPHTTAAYLTGKLALLLLVVRQDHSTLECPRTRP